MTPRLLRSAVIAATVAILALPAGASAANDLEVGIADENVLNGQTPGGTDVTVAKWKAAGVQDVRIFAQWEKLVPQDSKDKAKAPDGFKGTDPATYDQPALAGLDARIDAVVKQGMNVTLVVTGPGPVWGSEEPARKNGTFKPDPKLFGQFAAAIAKHVGPRVDRYIIWNEPNQSYWLQPQFSCKPAKFKGARLDCDPASPGIYRRLAVAGYDAIHANDQNARVAVGATSSFGNRFIFRPNSTMRPIEFLRYMGCVNAKYKAIKTGDCRNFKPVTGEALAYHPHSRKKSPGQKDPDINNARMADLPRLTTAIDKLTSRGRLKVTGAKRLPLWLDEYGYQTNPPDKEDGDQTPTTAAAYLQWGWSLAARNPRVQTLTQYEWFDESLGEDKNGEVTFNKWQSGLFTVDGKPKPLSLVFSNPIFGWRTAKTAHVWGQVRPGDTALSVRLQRRSGSSFQDYKTIRTDKNGIFQATVPRSTTAKYRFVYVDPNTQAEVTSGITGLRKTD